MEQKKGVVYEVPCGDCEKCYMYSTEMSYPVYQGRDASALEYYLKIRPAQLSCLSGSVGRASAYYAEHCGFKSYMRQLFFFSLEKKSCL